MSFWSSLCSSATSRPLQQLLDITYAGSAVTVCAHALLRCAAVYFDIVFSDCCILL
jgi:hypothetical protein